MNVEKLQKDLAEATADLYLGKNIDKHLIIIETNIKEIGYFLDSHPEGAQDQRYAGLMIIGFLFYRMRDIIKT
jgi:hypothetical protein